jgi:small subunit ribosomal protein S1
MLQARWKGKITSEDVKPKAVEAGQVHSFRITKLDPAAKQIEVELA